MALNAGKIKMENKFKQEVLEPAAYPGRVVQVIALGTQKQDAWEGQEKPPKPEIYMTYEFSDEFLKDEDGNDLEDKPRWMSERFTLNSLDSEMATSTKRYFSIDPENKFGGDFSQLIGMPCTINVVNKKKKKDGSTYDKIGSISGMREKQAKTLPELVNEPKLFDFDEPDMEVFGSLPQWLQDVIKEALDFEGSNLEKALNEEPSVKKKENDVEESQVEEDTPEEEEDW